MKNYYQILSYVFVILITLIIVLNIRFDKNTDYKNQIKHNQLNFKLGRRIRFFHVRERNYCWDIWQLHRIFMLVGWVKQPRITKL